MFHLDGVAKEYGPPGQRVLALQPTTLTIAAGEFVAVVGPSGSGKSTLLAILGAMLAPSRGQVWFDGQSIYDLSLADRAALRRRRIGFVFQSFNLVPYLTALENVQLPLLLNGVGPAQQRRRAFDLLEQFGLADRACHKPAQLSAGQQQRVALARTLAPDPAVILADEPTGNLDPDTRQQVYDDFETLHRAGKTIVLVTHDPLAAQRAGRVLTLVQGRVEPCERRHSA
ncbi:MAG: ABC transporter ATP-binding protein [Gemmataceae bacterium]|nr:ABC transporter ATP-binding protein [Gemmataceae bacterium]MDW8265226.1 ABC transporter ATP-binding protein [Gemmataceae bacterium]